jgi:hypothetical protein
MKMKKEHYDFVEEKMKPLMEKVNNHRKFLVVEGKAKDVEMRLRWDVFSTAGLTNYVCEVLYSYLDDSHIDTALKKILKDNQQ